MLPTTAKLPKAPAFQFYPGDWRKDPGVQSLNYHERGIWFEILCLMHETAEPGKLLLNGHAMPLEALACILGLDKKEIERVVKLLLERGVASQCPESSVLFSRRMVRDEELRNLRKECGKMGGNPVLLNQIRTTQDKQKPTPSSSSSPSSSSLYPLTPTSGGNLVVQQRQGRRSDGTNPRAIAKKTAEYKEREKQRQQLADLHNVPPDEDLPTPEFIRQAKKAAGLPIRSMNEQKHP